MTETLHGLVLTETSIIITVTSNGCTEKKDFKIELQESKPPIVTFIRVVPDPCKMVSHSIDITFSLKEIGVAQFKVANPFAPGPTKIIVTIPCIGAKSRDWYAWNNLMPPKPDDFHVIGEVQVPNPGVIAELKPRVPQGINPKIMLLNLFLFQRPGTWPQVQTWVEARYDKILPESDYEQVQIFCDDEIIAEIKVEDVR
ncbi:MAG: hypothetical protein QNJ54_14615 [Prochloraceae cyanobacterium]|nr:hypothetical protein [Prochloraceae cyanobacterium]